MDFLTREEVAKYLRVHPRTIDRWLKSGNLKGFKLGEGKTALWRIPEDEVKNSWRSTKAPNDHEPEKRRPLRYILRKSSEAEDRQIQSIDDQRRELREFAARNELNIIGEFEESQSAHHPGRPVFAEVTKRIEREYRMAS